MQGTRIFPEKEKIKNITAASEIVNFSVSVYISKFLNNYLEHA